MNDNEILSPILDILMLKLELNELQNLNESKNTFFYLFIYLTAVQDLKDNP